jgi:hypothetical protein
LRIESNERRESLNIYFDFEFLDNGKDVLPISLGVVSQAGLEYYVELPDSKAVAASDPWLKKNVLPHLDGLNIRASDQIAYDLIQFVSQTPNASFWGYFVAWDWYLICRLYGKMLDCPLGQRANDIAQEAERLNRRFTSRSPRHKAIDCARWTRQAHMELLKYET